MDAGCIEQSKACVGLPDKKANFRAPQNSPLCAARSKRIDDPQIFMFRFAGDDAET